MIKGAQENVDKLDPSTFATKATWMGTLEKAWRAPQCKDSAKGALLDHGAARGVLFGMYLQSALIRILNALSEMSDSRQAKSNSGSTVKNTFQWKECPSHRGKKKKRAASKHRHNPSHVFSTVASAVRVGAERAGVEDDLINHLELCSIHPRSQLLLCG